ncbi:group I truncated hemoglobin [Algoriphagus lutimaris]|uniref:group I truncated hemoglobin n=1 Tax=Algoriphagus lutimaris TaxID=613197 RepID=UPI001A9C357D|nr:group 1 truncated hemoglobin [Algoriphagus lutimaris]
MSNSTQQIDVSLFERLGKTDGITRIVEDVIQAHMENPKIQAIFIPYKDTPEKLEVILQHTVDFFSEGSGGPVVYKGRDMVTTHKGMNITPEEYACVVDDIMGVLEKHQIDKDSQNEVTKILESLKGMIIGQ